MSEVENRCPASAVHFPMTIHHPNYLFLNHFNTMLDIKRKKETNRDYYFIRFYSRTFILNNEK